MVLLFVKYLHVCMSISLVPNTFTRVKAHPSSVSFRFFLVMSFGQHYLRTFLAKRHGIMSLRSPGGSVIQCCVSVIHSDQTERDRCGPGIGLIVSHPHVCVCVCVCDCVEVGVWYLFEDTFCTLALHGFIITPQFLCFFFFSC